jgi:exopolysaccharide biosynthesis WecB/TagA/CpsF family protein
VRDDGKRNVAGVLVDVVDYEGATARIIAAASEGRPLAATALAVHGLVTAARDDALRSRVNALDMATPDGQPVRWALNLLHDAHLDDRVYGPSLMRTTCAAAESAGLPVFLYGSQQGVLDSLVANLRSRHPRLEIAGAEPSKFRPVGRAEKEEIAARVRDSGARIVFCGLGCPRQEVFAWEFREPIGLPILAVGAAFDYLAGLRREPPTIVQRTGLQWAWRLGAEPRRLWRRYLDTNTRYVALVAAQATGLWRPDPTGPPASSDALVDA